MSRQLARLLQSNVRSKAFNLDGPTQPPSILPAVPARIAPAARPSVFIKTSKDCVANSTLLVRNKYIVAVGAGACVYLSVSHGDVVQEHVCSQ